MHHSSLQFHPLLLASLLVFSLAAAGCSTVSPTPKAGQSPVSGMRVVPELKPGIPTGYFANEDKLDSLALLPPPPAKGSAAFANDEAVHHQATLLRDTPRYTLATLDAAIDHDMPNTFSCAIGAPIDAKDTPRLFQMLMRSAIDAGLSTYGAKNQYQRTRPFVLHDEPSCTPKEEAMLRKDGSYPSGHTTLGWAMALILAQVDPANANAILARGRSFGESRLVCNVHWQSDILQGRFMGASAVAVLNSKPEFREDIEIARKELAAVRAKGLPPARDCAAEAAALSQKIPGVQ